MVRTLLFAFSAFCIAVPATAATACDSADRSEVVSTRAARLAPEAFEAVRPYMTMWEIVKLLGPARREIGSGLMILAWDSFDGRVFLVGGTSLCQPPFYARFEGSDFPN